MAEACFLDIAAPFLPSRPDRPLSLRSQEALGLEARRPARGMEPDGRGAPATGDALVRAGPADDPPRTDADRVAAPGLGPLVVEAEHERPSLSRERPAVMVVDDDVLTVTN